MKKILYTTFLAVFVFFAGCSNNSNNSIYGDIGDNDYDDSASVPDNDSHSTERPDEAPKPGGGGSNGSGNQGGSNSSQDNDSEISDEETDEEVQEDNEEESDSDSGNNENPDSDSGNTENPDENNDTDEENGIYASEPNVDQCVSGVPTNAEKQKVLNRVNYIRMIHGLPTVVYDTKDDKIAAECALIIAANKNLSHTPDNSWKCYTQEAYDGCSSSNIHIEGANYDLSFVDSAKIVDAFLTEEFETAPITLGHRRWILDPWLSHISFGRADYADGSGNFILGSALKVINEDDPQDISEMDADFVAYPFENYPAELYNDNVMMSFTVIKNKTNKFANKLNINLASATISITDPNHKTIQVKDIDFDTDGYGVPNNLRWYAEGIKQNTKYEVAISNIMVDNVSTLYQYWFELK